MRALVAVLVLFGLMLRKKPAAAGPRGKVELSSYFKVNGKCMVKPTPLPGDPEIPSMEIPCDQWERERAELERIFFQGDG